MDDLLYNSESWLSAVYCCRKVGEGRRSRKPTFFKIVPMIPLNILLRDELTRNPLPTRTDMRHLLSLLRMEIEEVQSSRSSKAFGLFWESYHGGIWLHGRIIRCNTSHIMWNLFSMFLLCRKSRLGGARKGAVNGIMGLNTVDSCTKNSERLLICRFLRGCLEPIFASVLLRHSPLPLYLQPFEESRP